LFNKAITQLGTLNNILWIAIFIKYPVCNLFYK